MTRVEIVISLTGCIIALLSVRCGKDAAIRLKPGDRIVFLGDSITSQGVAPGGYVTLTAREVYRTFPDSTVLVYGAGISGNKVPDCLERLDRDVLSKKPTVVFIYIGINDVWHWEWGSGTGEDAYRSGLGELVRRIQAAGARVVLATPSVIGEKTDGSNRFDSMLDQYAAITRDIAGSTGARLLDLRQLFHAYLEEHNPADSETGILTRDGVHLNDNGNRFVAEQVMRVLGLDPGAEGPA
ncbi:SGNH/GDSL hydrolase family protein [bacterium]|nr:SGNH/GDSL hydrolase family protein [bacterium]